MSLEIRIAELETEYSMSSDEAVRIARRFGLMARGPIADLENDRGAHRKIHEAEEYNAV